MKIALAQIDTTVGDVSGNLERHVAAARAAKARGAELVVFPELSIAGYPAWDLLEHEAFVRACLGAVSKLAKAVPEPALVVGFPARNKAPTGKRLRNAAALLHKGKVVAERHKNLLPTYDVFDESRYFEPADESPPVRWNGSRLGLSICEDCWNQAGFWPRRLYHHDPIAPQIKAKVGLLVNVSASPYHRGKRKLREDMLRRHARKAGKPLLFCNLVGGNDELVFDGNSLVLDGKGRTLARGKAFEEDLLVVDLEAPPRPQADPPEELGDVRRALVLGLKDYARKTGFRTAVVGLSGGIDSAVTCALAVEALGAAHVVGVSMPSMFSSKGSVEDAEALAANLGVRLLKLPIAEPFDACKRTLEGGFDRALADLTRQNVQPRLRMTLLMAVANQLDAMLLSTGNKSEISTGYTTLYGDLTGGLALLADVPKTTVYELARHINAERPVIPEASITKPPSAELKPDQKDQDDLPPYELLDRVIEAYVERARDVDEIAAGGVDRALVLSVLERIDRSEYKRRQAPPGIKITPKAFGVGRRMPIARGSFRK